MSYIVPNAIYAPLLQSGTLLKNITINSGAVEGLHDTKNEKRIKSTLVYIKSIFIHSYHGQYLHTDSKVANLVWESLKIHYFHY